MIAKQPARHPPPLCITEAQLREGFETIDRGLAKRISTGRRPRINGDQSQEVLAVGDDGRIATIGAVRFVDAMHGMLEVVAQASSFEDPLLPPLVARDAPVDLVNPIVAVHAQIE